MAKGVLLQPDLPLDAAEEANLASAPPRRDERAERSIVPQRASPSPVNTIACTAEVGRIIAIR